MEVIQMFNFLSESLKYSKVRLPLLNLNEASPNFANCLKLGQPSSHQRPFQNLRCHFMQFAFFRSLGHSWIQHLILSKCILYFMIRKLKIFSLLWIFLWEVFKERKSTVRSQPHHGHHTLTFRHTIFSWQTMQKYSTILPEKMNSLGLCIFSLLGHETRLSTDMTSRFLIVQKGFPSLDLFREGKFYPFWGLHKWGWGRVL